MTALFLRLILRPLAAEKLRTALMVLAVTLGVAVVVAIDLASEAATGSFRASMESLTGDSELEITATGGVDEKLYGQLATMPLPLRWGPRLEGFAEVAVTRAVVPLVGLDLVQVGMRTDGNSIWVSRSLGLAVGERTRLTVNDRTETYTVRGVFGARDQVIMMDIGEAQRALDRVGRIDRIEVSLPKGAAAEAWIERLRAALPTGAEIRPRGTAQDGNRKMLTGFRWNLRALSYISLVVGAFLIYNAIAVSVVRRRAEIGIVRALGVTRGQVLALFLAEAAAFGLAGGALGLLLGRVMAEGAVKLLGATVESLYVSSRPGDIVVTVAVIAKAFSIGLASSLVAALAPAREAALVAPVEAMARGRRQYEARLHLRRRIVIGAGAAALAGIAYRQDAVNGAPLFGYLAVFLAVAATASFMPAIVTVVARALGAFSGVVGMLAARSLWASVDRASVLASALSTAIAMLVAVGIMVGSFRETVSIWMEGQIQADLYISPAAGRGTGATMAADVPDIVTRIEGVGAVKRFRAYEIAYRGLPAMLGGGVSTVNFLPGQDREAILARMASGGDYAIVSEPFANKHRVRAGDRLGLSFGVFEILGVYFDYSNERGWVILDRATLLQYLPDPRLSSLAVTLRPGADPAEVRRRIERATAGRSLVTFSNRNLRNEALRIFDRTFAITWALEAVAILVAVLGVAGALLALVIDRRREVGLLRFLGASAAQVKRLVLCEAGLLGLISNGAGLALGYVLSFVLIYVINVQSFGWTMSFHWPVALLILALSIVYAATLAAALYPARLAASLNPIEVIHEE